METPQEAFMASEKQRADFKTFLTEYGQMHEKGVHQGLLAIMAK